MSFRTTYILFGILGAIVIVFGLALWLSPPTRIDGDFLFPSAQDERTKVVADDIVRVEVDRTGDDVRLVFERGPDDKEFKLVEPAGYRISSAQVFSIINGLIESRTLKSELTGKLKDYGLEKPQGTVKLTTKKNRDLVLRFGDPSRERLYVTSSDAPKEPRAIAKSSIAAVFTSLDEFRARDFLGAASDDIKRIKIEKVEKDKKETVELEASGTGWRYVEPKYGAADLDGSPDAAAKGLSGVRALLTALTNLRAEGPAPKPEEKKDGKDRKEEPSSKSRRTEWGFVEDNAKDLKKYGLDSEADASIVLTITEEKEVRKEGEEKPEKVTHTYTVLIGKEIDKGEFFHARLLPDRHVLSVSKKSLESFQQLLANKEALRDRNLVKLSGQPDVVRIQYPPDAQNPQGQTIELVRSGGGRDLQGIHGGMPGFPQGGFDSWKLYGKDKKPQAADAVAIKAMLALINAPRSVEDFPKADDTALGLKEKNNLTVSLWVDGVKKSEKKEDEKDKDKKVEEEPPQLRSETPDLQLVFGRIDGKNLVAVLRRSGKKLEQEDVFKVKADIFNSARQDWLVYLDRQLPPLFPRSDVVNKITLDLDGKQTVIERKKADDPGSEWLLKKPAEWEGRKVDNYLLENKVFDALNGLRAKKWEALEPTPEQLGRWGLKTPAAKATVDMKVDGKEQSASLLIGNVAADKAQDAYYAQKSDDKRVFLIEKAVLESLKTPLHDRKIFAFQGTPVKSLKLTGWARLGQPATLELEKKGSGWEAKGLPAGVKINAGEVENLVTALSNVQAKKVVVFKTGPKDAHGLDVKKGALEIAIVLGDKDSTKLTLILGATDAEGLIATSNKVPGDVFVMDKGDRNIFEKVKEKLEFLASN